MIIRSQQVESFEDAATRRFENRTLEHLKQFAPRHVQIMGDSGTRRFMNHAIERASSYGLSTEHDLWLYMDLMILLGSAFDEDPQLPWARTTLDDPSAGDASGRLHRLQDKALAYLNRVAGPNNEYVDAAAARMLENQDSLVPNADGAAFVPGLARTIQHVYPEKAAYLGDDGVHQLVNGAIRAAQARGIATRAGVTIASVLQLMLGTGVFEDLQFPWVSAVLDSLTFPTPDQRIEALRTQGLTYLKRCLPA
jgi:hypothetical protein